MEAEQFLLAKEKYCKKCIKRFPSKNRDEIREKIMAMDEELFNKLQQTKIQSIYAIDWISFLLGEFGVDRFMIGDKKHGILKLIFCWSFFPWFIDYVFLINKATRNVNLKRFNAVIGVEEQK